MDDRLPQPDSPAPSLRASDAEREATAHLIQQSFIEGRLTLAECDERTSLAYSAQFQHDLRALTGDLVAVQPTQSQPAAALLSRVTGTAGPSVSIAIMGGCERKGAWTVSDGHTAVAIMGGISLDLRQASLQSHHTTIRAFALMGGIEIVVPDDIQVDIEGIGLLGGFAEDYSADKSDPRPVRQAPPGAPTLRVTGLAVMGGVGVRRVPRPHTT